MTPILLLVLMLVTDSGVQVSTEQIQFRTMESCRAAAADLEREMALYQARAVCIDRNQPVQ